MQNMEVFEMADGMGQTTKDEMAMFFFIVSDLDASREMIGADNCTEPFPMGENRRGMVLSNKALNLTVRTFMMEPLPGTKEPKRTSSYATVVIRFSGSYFRLHKMVSIKRADNFFLVSHKLIRRFSQDSSEHNLVHTSFDDFTHTIDHIVLLPYR